MTPLLSLRADFAKQSHLFQFEEVKEPSSILHPKYFKDEIASVVSLPPDFVREKSAQ